MRDLMLDVLSGQGPLFFADTCRISGDPGKGRPDCEHSARPQPGGGQEHGETKPEPPPVCMGTEAPSLGCNRDRGPRRASELDSLRRALRAELVPRP